MRWENGIVHAKVGKRHALGRTAAAAIKNRWDSGSSPATAFECGTGKTGW